MLFKLVYNYIAIYRIAGTEFRGVLIFVIFVVELVYSDEIFHPRKLMLPECACAQAVTATMWVCTWSRAWPAGQLKDRSAATTCQY